MKKGTCMLINVANIRRYECDIERNRKYFKLWGPYNKNTESAECTNKSDNNIKRTTGAISKSVRKYLSNITEKYEIEAPQATATLGTSHMLLKVLM
jgi:hypothetical protein